MLLMRLSVRDPDLVWLVPGSGGGENSGDLIRLGVALLTEEHPEGVLVPEPTPDFPLRLYLRTKSVLPSDDKAPDRSSTSWSCAPSGLTVPGPALRRPMGRRGRALTRVGVPDVEEGGEDLVGGCQGPPVVA